MSRNYQSFKKLNRECYQLTTELSNVEQLLCEYEHMLMRQLKVQKEDRICLASSQYALQIQEMDNNLIREIEKQVDFYLDKKEKLTNEIQDVNQKLDTLKTERNE
ncbi:hypothetical protein [Ligilactobacillus cholophilus]|uniref:hypothetical protein n=1 Tax=Ligilactobacillus cholophilus TaxID=3050131 RepID=UPI0025B04896|nr:hypothetical protein [Ligilactobacillus cholophilus]